MLLDGVPFAVDGTHPLPTPLQQMPMKAVVPSIVVMLYADEPLGAQPLAAVAAEQTPPRDAVQAATLVVVVVVVMMMTTMMMRKEMITLMARRTELKITLMLNVQGSPATVPKAVAV
jgi:hypothetical protein